ncbi:MAG TPA: hypothetical protein VF128_09355 [Gemmatimonadaceae bacterium]
MLIQTLAVATTVTACGGGSEGAAEAATDDGVAESVQIDVKPCEILKPEEISEQLFLAVPATERQTWTSPDFELSTTEPDIGLHKRCEYKFASRQQVGGGPVWHSDFEVMVLPANVVPLPEEDRKPIDGAGPDMFKETGGRPAYYVVKGKLAASITGFPGRREGESGGVDGGRVALLRLIAQRLP